MRFHSEQYPSLHLPSLKVKFRNGVYETEDPVKIEELVRYGKTHKAIFAEALAFEIATPLVTVAISCHNAEKYIKAALDSVKGQTYQNWEIVIVDDASTDKTLDIIRAETADIKERVTILENDINIGAGGSRRRSCAAAKGEILAILDGDDALMPEALYEAIVEYSKNPQTGIVYSTHYDCDKNLKTIEVAKGCRAYGDTMPVSAARFMSHFMTFKRTAYMLSGGYSGSVKRATDRLLYYRIARYSRAHFIDKPLYKYRNISSSVQHREGARIDKILRDKAEKKDAGYSIISDSSFEGLPENCEVVKEVRDAQYNRLIFLSGAPPATDKMIKAASGVGYTRPVEHCFGDCRIVCIMLRDYHYVMGFEPEKISDPKLLDKIRNSDLKHTTTNAVIYNPVPSPGSVEVIMLVYQRVSNLRKILKCLSDQTYKDFTVRLHNNNISSQAEVEKIVSKFNDLKITVSHSDNEGSVKKLALGRESKADVIMVIDDDMFPAPDFVRYMMQEFNRYGKLTILGWYGFVFKSDDYWTGRVKPKVGEEVDFIGSGSMVLSRDFFQIAELHNLPESALKIEDLWLSFIARKNFYRLVKIACQVEHLPDKKDQYLGLKEQKDALLLELKDRGWQFLRDRMCNFVVTIPTCNRAEGCLELLRRVKAVNDDRFDIKVIVYNDKSDQAYGKAEEFLRRNKWDYIKGKTNNGKHGYWKTITELWGKASGYKFDYMIHLNDDFDICDNMFSKIDYVMKTLKKHEPKACLNIWRDYRVRDNMPQWECGGAGERQIGGLSLNEIGWFDGGNVYPREGLAALGWRVDSINPKRWEKNKNLSSGVWSQTSRRLNKLQYKIFATPCSLVDHLDFDTSRMNPAERKKTKLGSYGFDKAGEYLKGIL